jgi:hypothetical protein
MVSALGDDAVVLGALAIALARAREKVFSRAMLLSTRDPEEEAAAADVHPSQDARAAGRGRSRGDRGSARPDR